MNIERLHQESWQRIEDPEMYALTLGYTDPEGRLWPSINDYNNALSKLKPYEDTQWGKIYLKPKKK
jgi:hypothetical protein